jgi:hyperosmotically inducible protein
MKNVAISFAIAALAASALLGSGCAVIRDQETVGAYIDDATITTAIKARLIDDKTVDASAIGVETLKGTVQLSGFAKSHSEKNRAEAIARKVSGVVGVQNHISVRP